MRSFHDTLTLPNGVVLKNRLAIAPLTVCLSDPRGYVTPQEVDYYASRTGEVGMYITGCSYVQPTSPVREARRRSHLRRFVYSRSVQNGFCD